MKKIKSIPIDAIINKSQSKLGKAELSKTDTVSYFIQVLFKPHQTLL